MVREWSGGQLAKGAIVREILFWGVIVRRAIGIGGNYPGGDCLRGNWHGGNCPGGLSWRLLVEG